MQVKEAVEAIFRRADALGLTTSGLAREAGLTRMTLNNWRSGRGSPTLDRYLNTLAALDRLEAGE